VAEAREQEDKHHEMCHTDTGDVLVLKLKAAFIRKARIRHHTKKVLMRSMSRRRLTTASATKKATFADVGVMQAAIVSAPASLIFP